MTFKIPKPLSETASEARFEFETPDGKTWRVPLFKFMPVEMAQRLLDTKNTAQMVDVLFPAKSPERGAIEALTPDQINALLIEWGKESGITLGESKASPNS